MNDTKAEWILTVVTKTKINFSNCNLILKTYIFIISETDIHCWWQSVLELWELLVGPLKSIFAKLSWDVGNWNWKPKTNWNENVQTHEKHTTLLYFWGITQNARIQLSWNLTERVGDKLTVIVAVGMDFNISECYHECFIF